MTTSSSFPRPPAPANRRWCRACCDRAGPDVLRFLHHPQAARARRWMGRATISSPARSSRRCSPGTSFSNGLEVFGNYYGTHRGILEEARAAGEGPGTRHRCPRCETIERRRFPKRLRFLSWPLRGRFWSSRLRARSEDRDEVIARRLREAAEEIRNYERLRLCFDQPGSGGIRGHPERDCSRRARPADQDRRPDPADSGHISSLKRYRRYG